jgi:HSP20 family protein
MSLVRWQPMKEVENLRRQMDRLFDEWLIPERDFPLLPHGDRTWAPAIEMEETDTDIILKTEIPGMEAKNLNVEVSEDLVHITGERQQEKRTEEKGFFRSEFQYGRFERSMHLPASVKNTEVKSEFKNGVLTLTLPKSEEARRKVVKVELADKSEEKTT